MRFRCADAHRIEQSGQDRHRVDPAHRTAALQHLVEKRRVHPLEQADIEQELPVLRPEAANSRDSTQFSTSLREASASSRPPRSSSFRESLSAKGQPADSVIDTVAMHRANAVVPSSGEFRHGLLDEQRERRRPQWLGRRIAL